MNPVDQFRYTYYEQLVAEERTKTQQLQLRQRNCLHRYDTEVDSPTAGYRCWECSKCGRTTMRRIGSLADPSDKRDTCRTQ